MSKTCFAVDLGATSGRTILATVDGSKVVMSEVTRFANPMIPLGGHLYWDIAGLYNEVLRGLLWYSQFFGLSLGRSFFEAGSSMDTLAFCILIALNVTFSNVWGIILKEWKGCSKKTIFVLIGGIAVLILSSFLPELPK